MLENSDDKRNILKNNNEDDPVTLADLKVNELIIKGINKKYLHTILNQYFGDKKNEADDICNFILDKRGKIFFNKS